MTNTLTIKSLVGNRVLVTGTDAYQNQGSQILDASEWNAVQKEQLVTNAAVGFDKRVEAFFKPLTEAAEALQAELDKDLTATHRLSKVVFRKAEEGSPEVEELSIVLSHDSLILRILTEGTEEEKDQLVWVNGTLEVLTGRSVI